MRKPHDPTKPTKNAEGNDVYELRTIGDLVVLYNHLPPEKRGLLISDTLMGLDKGGEAIDRSGFMKGLVKMAVRVSPIRWIDDDKGKVTFTVRMDEDSEPLFTKEL